MQNIRKKGTTNPKNRNKHENGQSRKKRDQGGEKGALRRRENPNKRHPSSIIITPEPAPAPVTTFVPDYNDYTIEIYDEDNVSTEIVTTGVVVYGIYTVIKWTVAAITAAPSGGVRLGITGTTP